MSFLLFSLSHMQCLFVSFSLPAYLDVALEKTHQQLLAGISQFEPNALHHTNTKERAILPDTSSESGLLLLVIDLLHLVTLVTVIVQCSVGVSAVLVVSAVLGVQSSLAVACV